LILLTFASAQIEDFESALTFLYDRMLPIYVYIQYMIGFLWFFEFILASDTSPSNSQACQRHLPSVFFISTR